ncbi:MAG: dolichyl-phosphate beta-glucosyltransferase [Pleopsidium flavum]|nr:MAG: dolichyl-phosphate beta-glucosyltransferase [Pleopsidium flavum]KAI9878117.1 MAG: dolichyl-phosphate beta-glucosyltransferase [Pleopsidium flavum]
MGFDPLAETSNGFFGGFQRVPLPLLLLFMLTTIFGGAVMFYLAIFIAAPIPRKPLPSEKSYRTIDLNGNVTDAQPLPSWQDSFHTPREAAQRKGDFSNQGIDIEGAEIFLSLVVPAYNERDRLNGMLEEAVDYLQQHYGDSLNGASAQRTTQGRRKAPNGSAASPPSNVILKGWEALIVSDGSTDKTAETALAFARDHHLPSETIRVILLRENRGKGGAVTHGMRHVRGRYVIFADADGASKFEDLGKLIKACQEIEDAEGRGVAVGSRAHLVGSEAVVKRSFLRNLLMHSFHLLLRLLTPPATAAIKDTQCGFKLFSRPSLPYIIPYMHSEGWIFDVEMLMLAELANIPVAEVPIGWKEVKGSKLNVVWDSLGMAFGLAILRAAWAFGVYRRS